MKNKKYEKPLIEVFSFSGNEIITASGTFDGEEDFFTTSVE